MPWTWRFEDARGEPVDELSCPAQGSQADAESWLGEYWRDLSAAGVARVVLLDGSDEVYRMPLTE